MSKLEKILIIALFILSFGFISIVKAKASTFETSVIERHTLRNINGKLGTLCEGILNGDGVIAVSRTGKLYATIEYQEDEPIAAFMCRQKDMACVRFAAGKIVWVSMLAGEELRDALNEVRGIVK